MQTEIEAFPFSERRDCISISACTRKANRKTCFMFFEGVGEEGVNVLLLFAVATSLYWVIYFFTGERSRVEVEKVFSPSSFSRNFPFQKVLSSLLDKMCS